MPQVIMIGIAGWIAVFMGAPTDITIVAGMVITYVVAKEQEREAKTKAERERQEWLDEMDASTSYWRKS